MYWDVWGGDEFLLLLPETDAENAALVMERIQDILASSPVYYGKIELYHLNQCRCCQYSGLVGHVGKPV